MAARPDTARVFARCSGTLADAFSVWCAKRPIPERLSSLDCPIDSGQQLPEQVVLVGIESERI